MVLWLTPNDLVYPTVNGHSVSVMADCRLLTLIDSGLHHMHMDGDLDIISS